MTRNYKRKPYRIFSKSHQYRVLAIILVYNCIIAGILVTVLFVPEFMRMNDQTLDIQIRAAAANDILMLHYKVWPVIFLLILVIGLHSIRMFNRFIGPLYRFNITFKDVQNGDLSYRIKLRQKDFLIQEANTINDMLDVINQKVSDIQTRGQDSIDLLNKIEQGKKENIDILRQNLDKLVTSANYFKTR